MRRILLAVPLLLVLASCGTRAGGESTTDSLRGKTFLATVVTEDGKARSLLPNTEVSVGFTDDGRMIAQAGCNTMQGPVDTAGGRLVVDGGLEMTMIGCDEARQEQDAFIAEVLGASPSWTLTGDRLTITSDTRTLELAPRESVKPDKELAGTTWVLDTLIDGDVASSLPAGSEEMTLVFDDERLVAKVFNSLDSEYTVVDDRIVFGQGVVTEMAGTPETMPIEVAVFGVLHGEPTYEITADRLTIMNASGKGIQLHAK